MKYHTIEGKTYCVVGIVEGTVTSASGVVITSFSANEQSYFTAPAGGFVTISDDTAIVTPVFDSAPAVLGGKSGGGGSSSFDMAAYNAFYGKYVTCTTKEEAAAINSDYKTDLTSWGKWIYDLPALTNGYNMFYKCENLRSFEGDLSALTNGTDMFNWCRNLMEWNTPLPKLTNGYNMFRYCSNLTEWNIPLPNLTNGDSMFYKSNLTSFSVDLSALTNGTDMFSYCQNLTSFSSDLSSLTDGYRMFYCPALTSFSSDLSALTIGSGMFGSSNSYCTRLDLASVQHIANTINDLAAAGTTGTIHIGMHNSLQSDDETAPINVALAAIRAKGWTVNELYND